MEMGFSPRAGDIRLHDVCMSCFGNLEPRFTKPSFSNYSKMKQRPADCGRIFGPMSSD